MAPLKRYPVLLQRFQPGSTDDYGNEIESWAPAVRLLIYGVNLPNSSEPVREAGHNRLIVDRVLLVPPSFSCDERDRVVLLDEPDFTYEVVGVQAKANKNPFRWNPGGHVNIRRVDG